MCNIALVTFSWLQYWSAWLIKICEHRKTCIFCVLSLVKPTKMSWNLLKIWSWNFISCSWEPWTRSVLPSLQIKLTHHKGHAECDQSMYVYSQYFWCVHFSANQSDSLFWRCRNIFDEDRVPPSFAEEVMQDIHSVSSLLKMYFRELPNPLLTYQLYQKFVVSYQFLFMSLLD